MAHIRQLVVATLAIAPWTGWRAHAQDGHRVSMPPAPEEHGATFSVEIHGSAEGPLFSGTICPPGPECVLGVGVGVGVQLERRSADRLGLVAAYDLWLLDSSGVLELGTLHALRGGLRYVLDDATVLHPFLDAGLGVLAFGDTATIATLGGVLTLGGGAEVEVDDSVALVAALEAWLFSLVPFSTRDGAQRSHGFGVDVAVQLTFGIAVLAGPSAQPTNLAR